MTQILVYGCIFVVGFCAGGLLTTGFWKRSLNRIADALNNPSEDAIVSL